MYALFGLIPDGSMWLPLVILVARMLDVSLGTVRIIAVTRGQLAVAVVLAFCEITIWVTALTTVFSNLDNWLNVVGFAVGFAAGNALGIAIDRKLALGLQAESFISQRAVSPVAERLRFGNYVVTALESNGRQCYHSFCARRAHGREGQSAVWLTSAQ